MKGKIDHLFFFLVEQWFDSYSDLQVYLQTSLSLTSQKTRPFAKRHHVD